MPALATELVGLKVDAIVTQGSAGARAAKQSTGTIHIVIAVVGDPLVSGVVASLSRPGGNITGLVLEEFESTIKWLELLKQVAPRASKVGWLDVPGIERPEVAEAWRQKEDAAAQSLGLAIRRVHVRGPNEFEDGEGAGLDDLTRAPRARRSRHRMTESMPCVHPCLTALWVATTLTLQEADTLSSEARDSQVDLTGQVALVTGEAEASAAPLRLLLPRPAPGWP